MVEFFARGGLIHYSWQLAQALQRQGAAVTLLTGPDSECRPDGDATPRLLQALRTWNPHRRPRGLPRRLVRLWRGLTYVRAWRQVERIAWRERPEVVLLTDLEHRCDLWFLRRLRRGPWRLSDIWHNVTPFERTRRGRLLRRAAWRKRLAGLFDTVFVHGAAMRSDFERFACRTAVAVPHGNQSWIAAQAGPDPGLDQRLALPPDRPMALLFGSLSEYKGIGVFLQALAALAPEARPVAVIAGMPMAGVRPGEWDAQARRLGVAPWVRWDRRYVPLPEVAWYFRRADIVVLPYRAASQSGVAHLALTFGRPLIVTEVGGLPELIAGNGIVIPPNDPSALALALERLVGDAGTRAAMGARAAHLAATRHDWDTIARRMLAAWNTPPPRSPI
jgi:glycosyltransferase involved in cell wall biosynthesis